MKHQRRLQRHLVVNLGLCEIAAAVVVPACGLWAATPFGNAQLPLFLSAFALALILVAGSAFWLRRSRGPMGARWARAVALVMIVAVASALIATAMTFSAAADGAPVRALVVAFGFQIFVIVEWINYRWVQIAAGGWQAWLHVRIVTPPLAKELRRHQRG